MDVGSLTCSVPAALRVPFVTGAQIPAARLVVASTPMGMSAFPTIVKPNRPDSKPKAASCWTAGFQETAGRPATAEGQVEAKAGR